MNSALCFAPNYEATSEPTENSVRQYSFLEQSRSTEKFNSRPLSHRLLCFFGITGNLERQQPEAELPVVAESFYMNAMRGLPIQSIVAGSGVWVTSGVGATMVIPFPEIEDRIEFVNARELANFRKLYPEINSFLENSLVVARRYFPSNKFILELVNDPDSTSDFEAISLRIQVPRLDQKLFQLLESANREIFASHDGLRIKNCY